jgi:hypothetical protein
MQQDLWYAECGEGGGVLCSCGVLVPEGGAWWACKVGLHWWQ